MIVRVERSEIDQAMRLLAARYQSAAAIERAAMIAAVEAAHTPTGADCGWTVGWTELRDGTVVAHVTPGPDMLDLLLPPAFVEDLLLRVRA